jgi:uncharacterized cupredoxin-like copper-binding protein
MTKVRYIAAGTVAAIALLAAQALPALGQATATDAVTAKEFNFKVAKRTVAKGTVVFTITNAGTLPHDFKIAGKKTTQIAPGTTKKLAVKFTKAGRYAYLCTVPGHAASGMKGSLTVR